VSKYNNESLTNEQIYNICRLVSLWEHKLTWAKLVQVIKGELGFYISRQSLSTYKLITDEYKLKKLSLRGTPAADRNVISLSEADLTKKVTELEQEVAFLTRERDKQLHTIETIFKNASEMPNVGRQGLQQLVKPRDD